MSYAEAWEEPRTHEPDHVPDKAAGLRPPRRRRRENAGRNGSADLFIAKTMIYQRFKGRIAAIPNHQTDRNSNVTDLF